VFYGRKIYHVENISIDTGSQVIAKTVIFVASPRYKPTKRDVEEKFLSVHLSVTAKHDIEFFLSGSPSL